MTLFSGLNQPLIDILEGFDAKSYCKIGFTMRGKGFFFIIFFAFFLHAFLKFYEGGKIEKYFKKALKLVKKQNG